MSSCPRGGDNPSCPFSNHPSHTAAANHDLDIQPSHSDSFPLEDTNHSPSILELIGLSDGLTASEEVSPARSVQELMGDSFVIAELFGPVPQDSSSSTGLRRPFTSEVPHLAASAVQ
ncbi:hypothetical protein GUJ93_ZPchr0001g31076 [Zizania palustris]|uniref:Uncharacterized protein n=1 Tax=Zizania palustris TaxID=103762 RepID=A0A8J5RMW6_ZIZPA|nr:hypothetical protein GUJ93_ZPchr0001g31076 [Zizania palustris]